MLRGLALSFQPREIVLQIQQSAFQLPGLSRRLACPDEGNNGKDEDADHSPQRDESKDSFHRVNL